MDIKQLRYFCALAEELHFQRAARNVNLTQPALSYQLKRLEEELGVTLIERDRRSVALTEAGEHFYNGAKQLLARLQRLVTETQEFGDSMPLTLRIGYSSFLSIESITRSILNARASSPQLLIEQIELPTDQAFIAVKEGEVDIGFGPAPVTHPTLKVKTVAEGQWVAVMSTQHPLATQELIPLQLLGEHPLVMFDRQINPSMFEWWLSRFSEAGIAPDIALETRQVSSAMSMITDARSIFIVASYIVESSLRDGMVICPLADLDTDISIVAAWHSDNRSQALAVYLDALRDTLE